MALDDHLKKDKALIWEVYKYPLWNGVALGMRRMDSDIPRPNNAVVLYSGCTYKEGVDFTDDVGNVVMKPIRYDLPPDK